VVLDIDCLDRTCLNAYVPILQTSSQVMAFLSGHLGFPFLWYNVVTERPFRCD
jgi:hypothetical protein